jgi:hypothetical protein
MEFKNSTCGVQEAVAGMSQHTEGAATPPALTYSSFIVSSVLTQSNDIGLSNAEAKSVGEGAIVYSSYQEHFILISLSLCLSVNPCVSLCPSFAYHILY